MSPGVKILLVTPRSLVAQVEEVTLQRCRRHLRQTPDRLCRLWSTGLMVKWFYNFTAPLFWRFSARTDGYFGTDRLAHSLLKICDVAMVTTMRSCSENL